MSKTLFLKPSAMARTVVVCVVAAMAIGPVASPKNSLAQEKRDDSSDSRVKRSDVGEADGDPEAKKEVMPERDELEKLLGAADKERLTYSADKKLLAHLDGNVVTVWSVKERRQLHRFVPKGRSLAVAFSPDGESLVTAGGEGNLEYGSTIKLWSLATGEGRFIAHLIGVPTHFSYSPDGSRLAATSNLNLIGSITRNPAIRTPEARTPEARTPKDRIAPRRIQTGGSIHVWQISNGDELLKVDIELPEYTAKLLQFWRDSADESDRNKEKAVHDALVPAYREAVRKRVPYRLNFSPDGQRLIGVSKSGQETILDSRTGKLLQPTSRGEQDGDDHPANALKSKGKEALSHGALKLDKPVSPEAGKGAIAPTGLTIVVCDSANHVLDTLVVAGEIQKADFEFTVQKGIDEIRVFAVGKRIVGIGGTGGIKNPQFRKMISEGLTKNYFVARSTESGGLGFVAAEIEQGVLIGISAGEAQRPLRVTREMQKQIREDIAAGKRAPIIYRIETETEFGGRITRVLAD